MKANKYGSKNARPLFRIIEWIDDAPATPATGKLEFKKAVADPKPAKKSAAEIIDDEIPF